MEVMYSNSINNKCFNNRSFIAFIGEVSDLTTIVSDITIVNLNENKKVKKLITNISYFDVVGLDYSILKKRVKDLSDTELKLVKLIHTCEKHPNLIILNNFDLGFNYKNRSKVSKLIKTINAEYKINFIIISNDIIFLNKVAKHLIISKNKIIKYQGDIMSAIKQGLVPKPPIIEFIDLANQEKAKLTYTLDNKELLKDIYRSVF